MYEHGPSGRFCRPLVDNRGKRSLRATRHVAMATVKRAPTKRRRRSLADHRHFNPHLRRHLSPASVRERGNRRTASDERGQSPRRRACCWQRHRRRGQRQRQRRGAQHCDGHPAGPQTRRRRAEEAEVPEEPGGHQARHRGGPAGAQRTHQAGRRAWTPGGDARFVLRVWMKVDIFTLTDCVFMSYDMCYTNELMIMKTRARCH